MAYIEVKLSKEESINRVIIINEWLKEKGIDIRNPFDRRESLSSMYIIFRQNTKYLLNRLEKYNCAKFCWEVV